MPSDIFLTKIEAGCAKPLKPCLTPTKDGYITLQDSPSPTLYIGNSKREEVYKIKLDGCFLPTNVPLQRCDWVLYSEHHKKILFIELKSNTVITCVEQFIESAKLLGDKEMRCCVLVSRRKNTARIASKLKSNGLHLKSLFTQTQKKKSVSAELAELLNACR